MEVANLVYHYCITDNVISLQKLIEEGLAFLAQFSLFLAYDGENLCGGLGCCGYVEPLSGGADRL